MSTHPRADGQLADAFALARRLLRGAGFTDRDTIAPARLRHDLLAPRPDEAQAYAASGARHLAVAVTRAIRDAAALHAAVEEIALEAWGYDVNILGTAPDITEVDELHLWLLDDAASLPAQLATVGFAPVSGAFAQRRVVTRFPDLPAGFAAPVFPVWTTPPGAAPFAPALPRSLGYACPTPPAGAEIEGIVRGFRIVRGGVAFRPVDRLRVVLPVVIGPDAAASAQGLRAAVALAHVLRDSFGTQATAP